MNAYQIEVMELLRDNLRDYIERMENGNRRDFEKAPYVEELDRLSLMIDMNVAPIQTGIDVFGLYRVLSDMYAVRKTFEEMNGPYQHARYVASDAHDRYYAAVRRYGEDSDEARRAHDEYESAKSAFDAVNASINDEEYANAAYLRTLLKDTYENATRVHVMQCANVARIALCDDTSWTKQPTHYKRMRAKAEAIANKALCGTGCRLSVYTDGTITVNHSYCSYFTQYFNHSDSVDIDTHADANGIAQIELMAADIEKHSDIDNVTISEVMELCKAYSSLENQLSKMRDEYRKACMDLIRPYERLGFNTAQLERQCRAL